MSIKAGQFDGALTKWGMFDTQLSEGGQYSVEYLGQGNGQFIWPVHGWISATRVYPDGAAHNLGSADISCTHWTKVVAARDGTVSAITLVSGTYLITVDHTDNYQTVYGHWAELPDLVVGQVVKAGEELGTIGRTGIATSPHMHFGILLSGVEQTIPGIAPGDWAQRGDYVPGFYSPLTSISDKIDTHVVTAACDQDAFDLADPTSSIIGTVARDTPLVVKASSSGFFYVTAFGRDVWIPYSSTNPLPLAFDGRIGAVGDHAVGEMYPGGPEQLPFLSGVVIKVRAVDGGANARLYANGPVLWVIKGGQLLTSFNPGEDGWFRVMDLSYPKLDGGSNQIPSRFAWIQTSEALRVEDFSVGVGKRDTKVYDAPSLAGNVLATLDIAAPQPSSGDVIRTYTLLQCISNVNGWYELANWPTAGTGSGQRAFVPGWQCLARR